MAAFQLGRGRRDTFLFGWGKQEWCDGKENTKQQWQSYQPCNLCLKVLWDESQVRFCLAYPFTTLFTVDQPGASLSDSCDL